MSTTTTAGSAGEARTFAKRLVTSDQVDLIVGGSTTGADHGRRAAGGTLRASRSSPSAGGVPVIDPVKKWVFKTPHTDRMAAQKVLERHAVPRA
ncbi:MAG: hypothetical protein U5L11_03205 [Arhodomonas sp.]|nr:hypothetical protein [Arhodomonas sp.]